MQRVMPQFPACFVGAALLTCPAGAMAVQAAELQLWAQCGGLGGNCAQFSCVDGPYPGQSCASGSSCLKQSQWWVVAPIRS